jgi:hypothetical protein
MDKELQFQKVWYKVSEMDILIVVFVTLYCAKRQVEQWNGKEQNIFICIHLLHRNLVDIMHTLQHVHRNFTF